MSRASSSVGIRASSLALRLTAWYVGSAFAILLFATIALYLILMGNLHREQDAFLADKVRVVRDMLLRHPSDMADLNEEVEQTWAPRQYARVYVRVLDADGKVIAESPTMAARLGSDVFPPPVAVDAPPHEGVSLLGRTGKPMRVVSARARIGPTGDVIATLQVALNIETAQDLVAGYRRTLLLVLGAGLASCGLAGYWLARIGLRPIRQIAATTQRVRSTNLAERINLIGLPAELSTFASHFNDMLGRLEDSFGRLSRFSADIAHELRTPVNNLRIEVEVGLGRARSVEEYRETLGSCLEECGRLGRIIDSMLFIARSEDPRTQIDAERLDVSRELERVREFFEVPATDAGVELLVLCAPNISADLDRTLFQRAVSNLVGNAIRYTPPGGRIAVAAARENGELRVDVTDTGTGISPDSLPHIFDRFFRADPSRSGASGNVGLGLAIVKSIVALHGGTISVRSKPNEGTCMSIRLPADSLPASQEKTESDSAVST
jgi:two-component system heavy metal sensor histidine kinase CusS